MPVSQYFEHSLIILFVNSREYFMLSVLRSKIKITHIWFDTCFYIHNYAEKQLQDHRRQLRSITTQPDNVTFEILVHAKIFQPFTMSFFSNISNRSMVLDFLTLPADSLWTNGCPFLNQVTFFVELPRVGHFSSSVLAAGWTIIVEELVLSINFDPSSTKRDRSKPLWNLLGLKLTDGDELQN